MKPLVYISALLLLLSCAAGTSGYYGPAQRRDVDILPWNTGVLRSYYCTVFLEGADRAMYDYLGKFPVFRGQGKGYPSGPGFSIIITNVWDKPFQVSRIEIITDDRVIQPEFYKFVKDPGYVKTRYALDLEELWKTRRLLREPAPVRELDLVKDTIEYRLDFIAPGDSVFFFRTFGWIPSGSRNVKFRIAIKYNEVEKVIDFDLADFEYYESDPGEYRILPEVILKNEN